MIQALKINTLETTFFNEQQPAAEPKIICISNLYRYKLCNLNLKQKHSKRTKQVVVHNEYYSLCISWHLCSFDSTGICISQEKNHRNTYYQQ